MDVATLAAKLLKFTTHTSVLLGGSCLGLLTVIGWETERSPSEVLQRTGLLDTQLQVVTEWMAVPGNTAKLLLAAVSVSVLIVGYNLGLHYFRPANDDAAWKLGREAKRAEDRRYAAYDIRFWATLWIIAAVLSQVKAVGENQALWSLGVLLLARAGADFAGGRRYAIGNLPVLTRADLGWLTVGSIAHSIALLLLALVAAPLRLAGLIVSPRLTKVD